MQGGLAHTDPVFMSSIDRLNATPEMKLINCTQEHIDHFANSGLRTLAVAWRQVSSSFYQDWKKRLDATREIMDDEVRESSMMKLNDEIETNMDLLGATAIEDKLQAS